MTQVCGAKLKRSTGTCKRPPMKGATRCHLHGGALPQVQNKIARERALARAEQTLKDLGEVEPVSDPFAALEDIAGQTVKLCDVLRGAVSRLEQIRFETEHGENIRGELQAYLAALGRAESVLAKIISLDLASRRLTIEEAKSAMVVMALEKALRLPALDLTSEQQRVARAVVARELGAPDVVVTDAEVVEPQSVAAVRAT